MLRRSHQLSCCDEYSGILTARAELSAHVAATRRCVLFLTNLADGRTKFARGVLAERPVPQPGESQADHLLTMLLACDFGVTCLTF